MAINVTPIAGLSDHINDVRQRTARIVNEEILPNESRSSGRPAAATPPTTSGPRARCCGRRSRTG